MDCGKVRTTMERPTSTWNIDPELEPFVPMLPTNDLDDVDAAREALAELIERFAGEADESALEIEDRVAPGAGAQPDVPVRVYRPRGDAPPGGFAGLLYLHGGAFVLGSVDTEHIGAVQLATHLGIVVVSVDYRLAPEHPFPAGPDDCYHALCWLHEQVDALSVDATRVAVMGQSAGGGLAASVALMARDRDGPALCFQFLGIPELDDRLDTPSMQTFVDTPMWTRRNAELSWRHYLGDHDGVVSPYAAPARADDLSGLPPAYVSTMEFDPLRDEGILYALRLLQAGVPVELHQYPGTFHGSAALAFAEVSKRQAAEQGGVLRRALGLG